jgi:hypothetical protein
MTRTQDHPRFMLVLAVVMAAAPFCARAGNGGSSYSRYGIGDLQYNQSSSRMSMGGTGIAFLSIYNIDPLNPACWTRIVRTTFMVGATYEALSTRDDHSSAFLSSAFFNGFMIAWPIAPAHGVVLGAGVSRYSNVNYNIIAPGPDYDVQYKGDGGLSEGYLGISTLFLGEIHLGARLNYYFGTLNYSTRQVYDPSTYAEVVRAVEPKGPGLTLGAVYSGLRKVLSLPEGHSLNAGVVFTTTSTLAADGDRYYTYLVPPLTTRDTVSSTGGTLHLPLSLGGGISYTTERISLAADLFYQEWSRFTATDITSAGLRDSYRASAGAEFIPKRDPGASVTQRTVYRLGAFYNSTYYDLNGEPINEMGLAGGVGIPVFGETRLSIAAEYSLRGTTENNLQKDKVLRVSMTLSGSELWFLRPPEE